MTKPKKTAQKKTATDKRMDTVLRRLLATPPQPHEVAPKKPGKRAASQGRDKSK